MEFLMTYGWAILVVIIIIALLLNSRIGGDPTLLLQENCEFYITVFCLDYFVEEDQIKLSLQNIAERDITVKNIIATSDALEGQCELTGIHMGQPLKNGEDFLFQLNRTVMVDGTFAPPASTNINWNLPESQILLARAQGSDDTDEIELLHKILTGTNTDTHYEGDEQEFGNLLSELTGPSKTQFNTQLRDPSLIDPSSYTDLTAYKARVISVLEDILDNATNRNYTAYNISKEANLSNSSFTKDVLWNTIINETETSIFSLPPGRGNNLETYATSHSDYATSDPVRLGCEDLDTLKQARLNYAAYEIFVNTNASNADPSLSREELYNNLSRSIAFIKAFYSGFEDDEEAGVNEMASIINNSFKNPPNVSLRDADNLVISCGDKDGNGSVTPDEVIDQITLNNFRRAWQVTYQFDYAVHSLVDEDFFGSDAYCALSVLVSDITTADRSRGGGYGSHSIGGAGRDNFNNDGVGDEADDEIDFFELLLNKNLTEINSAVDDVAGGASPDDYRYSDQFNGADMNMVIKIIHSEGRIVELVRITNGIIGIIINDDSLDLTNLDSASKDGITQRVLGDSSFDLNYYSNEESIGKIIDIIGRDYNIRISKEIIEHVDTERGIGNTYYPRHDGIIGRIIKLARTDSSFGLDGLNSQPIDDAEIERALELFRILNEIYIQDRVRYNEEFTYSDSPEIRQLIRNGFRANLNYYSDDDSIARIIDIIRGNNNTDELNYNLFSVHQYFGKIAFRFN